jgi:hypothetical protein
MSDLDTYGKLTIWARLGRGQRGDIQREFGWSCGLDSAWERA